MAKFFCSTGNTCKAKRSARMRSSRKGTDCCANRERAKVCGRRTLIYRVFLVLAIAAAVWCGVNYIMGVRSGEQLQNGVELVKDTDADGLSHWNGKDTELFQRMVYFV